MEVEYGLLITHMVKERHLRLLYQLAADIIITITMNQQKTVKSKSSFHIVSSYRYYNNHIMIRY
jgi:hypothetical protein